MPQKFDDNEWQFYLILFLIVIMCLILYVAVHFWWIRAPDVNTPEGKCRAFCAGLSKKYLGHGDNDVYPMECFCDFPPIPIDKRLLRRP